MATKTATPSRRRAAAPASHLQIVVRRGSDRRFASLKEQTSDLPVVVTWDRRTADRRRVAGDIAEDRRRTDRRKKAPFTWDTADFLVLTQSKTKKAKARKA